MRQRVVLESDGPARGSAEVVAESDCALQPLVLQSQGLARDLGYNAPGVDLVAGFSSCGSSVEPSPKGNPKVLQEKALQVLATESGRELAAEALRDGMLASSARHAKEAKLLILQRSADVAGVALYPLTLEGLEPILGSMKLAGYTSADSCLAQARVRHMQLQCLLSDSFHLFLKDAARSVVSGRGPVRRAPAVRLEELVGDGVPARWADQARFEFGLGRSLW